MTFFMPHDPSMRPAWLIRLGLFMYDHLASRQFLASSRRIQLSADHPLSQPLKASYTQGFTYADGWVNDSRLVVLNAQDAQARGAEILTRTRCVSAHRGVGAWSVDLLSTPAGGGQQSLTVQARFLVNAAGPWAASVLENTVRHAPGTTSVLPLTRHRLRLVQGSHMVVPRLFEHDHAYIFQTPDDRVIFAVPFEDQFTLIGTTDLEISQLPSQATIKPDEVTYLCEQANRYFQRALTPADVCWHFSGIRPLLEDASENASAVTRDYLLETSTEHAPVMTVWGGKITTYRKLAEEAADTITALLGRKTRAWTATAPLPGGDLQANGKASLGATPQAQMKAFLAALALQYPWLPHALLLRWAQAYGSQIHQVIGPATDLAALEPTHIPGIYLAEVRHLINKEWVCTGDDLLWRRTKLGLELTPEQQREVSALVASLLAV
jgi:glycerol-3-phosphate dehydrogenase